MPDIRNKLTQVQLDTETIVWCEDHLSHDCITISSVIDDTINGSLLLLVFRDTDSGTPSSPLRVH